MPVRKSLATLNCSLAKALDVMGDGWSMLILRDLFIGARRFQDIATSTGMPRNILTGRLKALTEAGVVGKQGTEARPLYTLTDKGFDIVPALVALMQWGDRWYAEGGAPMVIKDHKGRDIPALALTNEKGKPLDLKRLSVEPGPGAEATTKAWLVGLKV
jgi:DNA-binding HxlR family transcriptional regulator